VHQSRARNPPAFPEAAEAISVPSATITSTPRRLRKYAAQAPMTPPPQITTRMISSLCKSTAPRIVSRRWHDPHDRKFFEGTKQGASKLKPPTKSSADRVTKRIADVKECRQMAWIHF
jgi:hypothetical protein